MVLAKDIIEKIERVPEELKPKLTAFVDKLLEESNISTVKNRPVFGSGKDMFGKMTDDFDEPLDEFKDYM